ncbi:unnamed protein product, partial [Rotaria sordida]
QIIYPTVHHQHTHYVQPKLHHHHQ